MKVHHIHAFEDNFIFAVEQNKKLMIVDPGDASPVLNFLKTTGLSLDQILLTHCHHDHIGGVQKLIESSHHAVKILGPARLKEHGIIPDQILTEGSSFQFEKSQWQCMNLPGHTLDHMAYFNRDEKILFCGDILFSLGCGRLFEGSYEQGFDSLQRIKALPIDTKIYFAHEYTLTNCDFHLAEYHTQDYKNLRTKIVEQRLNNKDTVPSTLEFELNYNGFLKADNISDFKNLRIHRNHFTPTKDLSK